MARDAPVNIAPPECSTVVSTAANSFIWQPDSFNMHVIRPKSAKGRMRPSLHKPQDPDVCSHRTPASPPPTIPSSQKPGPCAPKSPNQGTPGETPERMQQVPFGASSSLNKYPVLPSITRKTLDKGAVETGALQLSSLQVLSQEGTCARKTSEEEAHAPVCSLERRVTVHPERQSSSQAGDLEEPPEGEPRLLLAVRSPSGRRFVRHFRPTDDLQTVVAVAEHKNKTAYPRCSIETMEVPRRRFSDLSRSLQDCGIPHKSVLGICLGDRVQWP